MNLGIYLRLHGCAAISVVLSGALYLIKRKTPFGSLPYAVKQIIIGVLFGGVAMLGTEMGVDVGGAVANARDAAPLCAGLLFGAPAGIIAGLMGGVWRWFSVYFGAGMYSRLACTVSTILAGLYAAFLRKVVFDNKRPSHILAFATGAVMEVIHMVILFLTHITEPVAAYDIVKLCSIPMILCNGVSCLLSALLITILFPELHRDEKRHKNISQLFQIPTMKRSLPKLPTNRLLSGL